MLFQQPYEPLFGVAVVSVRFTVILSAVAQALGSISSPAGLKLYVENNAISRRVSQGHMKWFVLAGIEVEPVCV